MFSDRPAGGKSYFVEGSGASVFPARRLFYTESQMLVIISSPKKTTMSFIHRANYKVKVDEMVIYPIKHT